MVLGVACYIRCVPARNILSARLGNDSAALLIAATALTHGLQAATSNIGALRQLKSVPATHLTSKATVWLIF